MDLETFTEVAYAGHDPAHGRDHVIKVLNNARIIAEGMELTPDEQKIFDWVMIGHDAADHKIPVGKRLSDAKLAGIYAGVFGPELAAAITEIHQNCSWSRRHTRMAVKYETLLKILQDADWIEALVLQRTIDYTMHHMPGATTEVIRGEVRKHIREKLLLIPTELNYESSRGLVDTAPLHAYLAD